MQLTFRFPATSLRLSMLASIMFASFPLQDRITINVPLFKKLRDIIFFLRDNHFLSHFMSQSFLNSGTLVILCLFATMGLNYVPQFLKLN